MAALLSVPCGTTRSKSPSRYASCASIGRPVKYISRILPCGRSRIMCRPPPHRPTLISGMPIVARSEA
jgi:hypothetical protein